MFYFSICSKWPPSSLSQNIALLKIAQRTRRKICGLIVRQTRTILSFKSSTLAGCVVYTCCLRWPHRKKSKGVRSGERGGHSRGPWRPIQWFPNFLYNSFLVALAVCAGWPSCWNHMLARNFSGTSSNKVTSSFIRKFRYTLPSILPSKKYGPMMWSPRIPAQTFTDHLTCVCVCCIQWGFSVAQ